MTSTNITLGPSESVGARRPRKAPNLVFVDLGTASVTLGVDQAEQLRDALTDVLTAPTDDR